MLYSCPGVPHRVLPMRCLMCVFEERVSVERRKLCVMSSAASICITYRPTDPSVARGRAEGAARAIGHVATRTL